MKKHRLVAIVAALGCATGGALLPSAGCGGDGTTPVCTFDDGAINPEAGCGTPVEASSLFGDSTTDAPEDQGTPANEDATDTNPSSEDASDSSLGSDAADASDAHSDADAHVGDAHEDAHDAHIQDAKNDSKG